MVTIAQIYALISQYAFVREHKISPTQELFPEVFFLGSVQIYIC